MHCMKTIKCSQVGGGTCAFEASGTSADEIKQAFMAHAKEAHADMVAAATPESMEKWNADFEKVYAETPEA